MGKQLAAVLCLGLVLLAPTLDDKGLKGGEPRLDLTQRYLILATSRMSTMQEELSQAAAAGYRVLTGGSAAEINVKPRILPSATSQLVILLEKVAAPSAPYEYLLLSTIRSSTLQKELREAAARGFHLVPNFAISDTRVLMERSPGSSSRYDYVFLTHEFMQSPPASDVGVVLSENINLAAAMQDYSIVGMACRSTNEVVEEDGSVIPRRYQHVLIAEKAAQSDGGVMPQEPRASARKRYLILKGRLGANLEKLLNRSAEQGYRLLISSSSGCEGAVLVMEKVVRTDQAYTYLVVSGDQLNEAARKGFQPHPAGIFSRLGIIMEKAPGSEKGDEYLFLESTNSSDSQEQLAGAGAEGLNVVAASRSARVVILQKTREQVAESRAPQVELPPPSPGGPSPSQPASDGKELEQLRTTGEVLKAILDIPDNIPRELLAKAACVMVIPLPKLTTKRVIVGGPSSSPRAAMSCRTGQDFAGSWSAPAVYRLERGRGWEGGLFTGVAGGDWTGLLQGIPSRPGPEDLVLLVMGPMGANSFLRGTVKLGLNVTMGAGPKGRAAPQNPPEVLGYSRFSDGSFAGVSLEGAVLGQDKEANKNVYGREISARDIVRGGQVAVPAAAQLLVNTLTTHAPVVEPQREVEKIGDSPAAQP